MSKLVSLGKRTVFHVPEGALDRVQIGAKTARDELHEFLKAWSDHLLHTSAGRVRILDQGRKEAMESFEVSLATDREFRLLVDFLKQIVDGATIRNIPISYGEDCFHIAADR